MGRSGGSDGGSAPAVWIGLAAVLGIAVIGLGIWSFGQKADLDDTKEKISKLESQAGSTKAEQKAKFKELTRFAAGDSTRYRAVKRSFISANTAKVNFRTQVTQDANALQQAKKELAAAKTEEERLAAQPKVSDATSSVAITCAQSTVDALSAFDKQGGGANNPAPAAETAMNKLEGVAGPCKSALNAGG